MKPGKKPKADFVADVGKEEKEAVTANFERINVL